MSTRAAKSVVGLPARGAAALGQAPNANTSLSRQVPAPEIDIVDSTGRLTGVDQDWLNKFVAEALRHLSCSGRLAARVIGDAEMAAAHLKFAGVQGTTDVLTFDLSGRTAGGVQEIPSATAERAVRAERAGLEIDVDVLICIDEAHRQAGARGLALRHELLLYIIHGVLHCLGHDDHDDEAYRIMHAREDEIMGALGLPIAFAAESRGNTPSNAATANAGENGGAAR